MNMREKIAKSIYERRNGHGAKPWAHQPQSHREPYMSDADAVLDALMEPTEGMHKVGTDRDDGGDRTNSIGVFQAMIKAAMEGK